LIKSLINSKYAEKKFLQVRARAEVPCNVISPSTVLVVYFRSLPREQVHLPVKYQGQRIHASGNLSQISYLSELCRKLKGKES